MDHAHPRAKHGIGACIQVPVVSALVSHFSRLGWGPGCLLTVDTSGVGRGWRRVVPKGVWRRHLTGLFEVTWCPQGPAAAGSQGYALYGPGGGAAVLGDLQCLGGGRARELRVLRWVGRRSKAQDGHCWERTRTCPPGVKPKVAPSHSVLPWPQ